MEFLILHKGGLGIFEIPFRDQRVFFGGVSLPSDQEEAVGWGSAVAYYFVFFSSLDKVRWWCREVLSINGVFFIRG